MSELSARQPFEEKAPMGECIEAFFAGIADRREEGGRVHGVKTGRPHLAFQLT
jgi:hypothetical protein